MFRPKINLHHESKELGVSFDLPEILTGEMDTRYQAAVNRGHEVIVGMKLPFMGGLAYGVITGAALESGLIQNWQSLSMPKIETEADVDVAVVYYVAPIILEYRERQLNLPKVSFWRLAMRQLTTPRPHQN